MNQERDTHMNEERSRFDDGLAVRREVMGGAYVDAVMSDTSDEAMVFQRFVTETAWGQWADGTLTRRERSLVTVAMLVVLNRMEEFELHVRGAVRNGVSRDELASLVMHVAAYAGLPAGIAARRHLINALNE
jgi:alkylhydroperoxidase/carboxymuconolactone decarboxylase family protein YurZ